MYNTPSNFRRVYKDLGNNTAVATNSLQCQNSGRTVQRPIGPQTQRILPLAVARQNFPVISAGGSGGGTGAINEVQSNFGVPTTARREYMEGAGTTRTYQIGFLNNSDASINAYIGDGNTIAFQSQNGAALPGRVAISGTWGSNSLAIWKLVTSNTPVRLSKLQLNFDASSFLTNGGALSGYKTRPDNIDSTDNYNLSTWLQPSDYQSLVIVNPEDLAIIFDATYALVLTIPTGRTVTLTMYYTAVADVHNFRQQ